MWCQHICLHKNLGLYPASDQVSSWLQNIVGYLSAVLEIADVYEGSSSASGSGSMNEWQTSHRKVSSCAATLRCAPGW